MPTSHLAMVFMWTPLPCSDMALSFPGWSLNLHSKEAFKLPLFLLFWCSDGLVLSWQRKVCSLHSTPSQKREGQRTGGYLGFWKVSNFHYQHQAAVLTARG